MNTVNNKHCKKVHNNFKIELKQWQADRWEEVGEEKELGELIQRYKEEYDQEL